VEKALRERLERACISVPTELDAIDSHYRTENHGPVLQQRAKRIRESIYNVVNSSLRDPGGDAQDDDE
jgi:hypothetical protein